MRRTTKRRLLTAGATSILGALSGCVALNTGVTGSPSPSRRRPTPKGPIRGESQVDLSVTRSESDDSTEYLEETGQVRYVARREGSGSSREQIYETMSFIDWAQTRCAVITADAAKTHVMEKLNTDNITAGITSMDNSHVAFLEITIGLDREGEIVHTPSISFEELAEATPSSVESTYVLESRTYERTVPVYTQLTVAQEQ